MPVELKQAEHDFRARLASAALDVDRPDAWEAWKVFKAFLAEPVVGSAYDAGSFQCWVESEAAEENLGLVLVRQFSQRERDVDSLVGRVILEWRYRLGTQRLPEPVEVWTQDFPTLAEFATTVESQPQFQLMLNLPPSAWELWGEGECES